MAGIDPGFAAKVRPGDIIVGEPNFGCGSSREEAAAAMKEAGIAAVVAPSFGRLFTRNCINLGLPVLTSPAIDEHVEEGDELEIDLSRGVIRNTRNGYEARLPPMAPESLKLLERAGSSRTRSVSSPSGETRPLPCSGWLHGAHRTAGQRWAKSVITPSGLTPRHEEEATSEGTMDGWCLTAGRSRPGPNTPVASDSLPPAAVV
jgi:3-isopropylmalate/(R)-2-methylmalate dehydratase small subunit